MRVEIRHIVSAIESISRPLSRGIFFFPYSIIYHYPYIYFSPLFRVTISLIATWNWKGRKSKSMNAILHLGHVKIHVAKKIVLPRRQKTSHPPRHREKKFGRNPRISYVSCIHVRMYHMHTWYMRMYHVCTCLLHTYICDTSIRISRISLSLHRGK